MEKIKSLIDELKNFKNDFENKEKYNFKIDDKINSQVNFNKRPVKDSLKDEVKKIISIYEEFINLANNNYNFSSKLDELSKIKISIENALNDYIKVLDENYKNFKPIDDENTNKRFLNLYKRINLDLVDKFKSIYNLFNALFTNIKNFVNGLRKNKKKYEEYGEDCPDDESNFSPKKIEEYMSKVYKTIRNIEELVILVEDTLIEIKKTKKEWNENKNQFKNRMDKINPLLSNSPNIDMDRIREVNDNIINIMDKFNSFSIKEKEANKANINKEKMRLDILFILDTTFSMAPHLEKLKNNLKNIIESIKEDFPLAIVKTGLIGYKDFKDLEVGDDYIDIDFLIDYKKLIKKIEEIDADGGEGVNKPKDVAGAFELALSKSWGKGKSLAILITDSPCHGEEYNDTKDQYTDGYNESNNSDFEREKIKYYLEKFIKKNIYLIGYIISKKNTEKMYNKFQDFYKEKNKEDLFSNKMGALKDIIKDKVKDLLKDQKKEVMNI